MTPAERYQLDSADTQAILGSPEAFEIVDVLLKLYRSQCRTELRQQETIQALLARIYGRKSEKSRYHPDQALLLPELLEELIDEAVDASQPPADAPSENERDNSGNGEKQKRGGGHGRSKLPKGIVDERAVVGVVGAFWPPVMP